MAKQGKVGIIGDGQLARMLVQEGCRIGVDCVVLGENPESSAARVAEFRNVQYSEPQSIVEQSDDCAVLTYEMEHLPVASLRKAAAQRSIQPSVEALAFTQDRLLEKEFLAGLGIKVAPFSEIEKGEDLHQAAAKLSYPFVLKTRTAGYDGKGQLWINDSSGFDTAAELLANRACIAEAKCSFDRELSLVVTRNAQGHAVFYPLVMNEHHEGVLAKTVAPAPGVSSALSSAAQKTARSIMEALDYVGVLSIEFFEVGGELWVNELAPRVHNSGHWTLEGASCSQFENHLRAITSLPLGDTTAVGHSIMYNILGQLPSLDDILRLPHARLHLYNKAPAPKRKIGHITLHHCDVDLLRRTQTQLEKVLGY